MSDRDIQIKINALVEDYLSLEKKKGSKLKEVSEADVRADFIDRLFEILGWNIHDVDEYNREKYVRGAGFADITLQIDNEPAIFVEAKRFNSIPFVDREKTDWIEEERQVLNYAASPSRKIKWAVLTNFEKFRLFNALNGMLVLSFESIYDYKDRFQDLLYLSREMVSSGRLNELTEREERPDIDERFLDNLKSWRLSLAKSIYEKNKENSVLQDEDGNLEIEKLKNAVQRILDRLITVRYAEDKLILDSPDQLKHIRDSWYATRSYSCLVKNLMNFFEGFDRIHDSKIFERGHICEQVEIDDEVLGKIIEEMYNINFRKFDFDVLGNTYETYLGHTIHIDNEGNVSLKPTQASRKEHGIYYTPPYIVDYIVKNTVGKVLQGKSPEEVKKIRVLDPACGSGSFLIKAYDYFQEHYAELSKAEKNKVRKSMAKNNGQLPDVEIVDFSEYEKDILKDNIFGVDLDSQAAEIASVNLMLKALRQGEKLPLILGENIQVGNSLISGTDVELQKYFGKDWQDKKPFNWEEKFKEAFEGDDPGFDVVIGNPPYVTLALGKKQEFADVNELNYYKEKYKPSSEYKVNTFAMFIERCIEKLKNNGKFGFIIPSTILTNYYFKKIRRLLLDTCKIVQIVSIREGVFKDAVIGGNILLILEKERDETKRKNNMVKTVKIVNEQNFSDGKYTGDLIKQEIFEHLPYNKFLLEKTTSEVITSIEKTSLPLGEIATFYNGIKTGDNKNFLSTEKESEIHKEVLRGRDISRYSLKFGNHYVLFDKDKLWSNTNEKMFLAEEKIIVRQTCDHLVGAYDNYKYFTLDSTHLIIPHKFGAKYILTLINSKLMNFYYYILVPEKGRTFAEVKIVNLKKLPIHPASPEQQKLLISLADRMLSLNRQMNEMNIDFDHYVNQSPREKDSTLEIYLKELHPADIKVGKDGSGKSASQIEGKVTNFDVGEEGDNLTFEVRYEKMPGEPKMVTINALTCKISDENFRKFLYYSLTEYVTPGNVGKGKIYERLLKVKLPCFALSPKGNKEIINKLMKSYLPEIVKYNELKQNIKETDKEIDSMVYELYGLSDEEIKIVEESMKAKGD